MQHKWMVLLTTLVLFSLLFMPFGAAHAARTQEQDAPSFCPPYQVESAPGAGIAGFPAAGMHPGYKQAFHKANPPKAENAEKAQGPDGFGYTYHDAFPYNWISATTNSGLSGDDKFTGPWPLGLTSPFTA